MTNEEEQRKAFFDGMYGAMDAEKELRAAAEALAAETGIAVEDAIKQLRGAPGRWQFTPKAR